MLLLSGGGAMATDDADGAPLPTTVFLVCDGEFRLEREAAEGISQEIFDGSLYVSITYTGNDFSKIQLQPFERDERLPAQNFEPNSIKAVVGTPANEQSQIRIHATEDEVILHQTKASGAIVRARVGDRPLVPIQARVKSVDMTLNRFSGGMMIDWVDRRVGEYKPRGAIRATKVTYHDRKSFDATCHTMKERLF